jgi:hypothetical protein
MPIDSQAMKKKVGHPSHANKSVQAKVKANLQNTITAAAEGWWEETSANWRIRSLYQGGKADK